MIQKPIIAIFAKVSIMEDYRRSNQAGVIFSQIDVANSRSTYHVREHSLLYIRSGFAEVDYRGRKTSLKAGDCVFLRKDHQVILSKYTLSDGVPFQSVGLRFCRRFLLENYRLFSKRDLPTNIRRKSDPVLKIPAGPRLESLFRSLVPYLESDTEISEDLAWMKRREGLLCLLETDPSCYASLFDFSHLWKVDLLAFLEENYKDDLSLKEMAYYTGRSLSSFKRDFSKVSDLSPKRWVIRRRLEDAHRLLCEGKHKVSDAMEEAGFKDPASFSRAYKRQYGYPPRYSGLITLGLDR